MVDPGFALDERLEKETRPVMTLGLCRLLLKDDRRWPWVILVPQRAGIVEIHDLQPLDQAMLAFETNLLSEVLKQMTGAAKINSGALGNRIAQLHVHIVARNPGDPHWPDPVWGQTGRIAWPEDAARAFSTELAAGLHRGLA